MKKIFLVGGLLGLGGFLFYAYRRGRIYGSDAKRISLFLQNIGVPQLRQGLLTIPLQMGLRNPTGSNFDIPTLGLRFFVEVFIRKKDGTLKLFLSGSPRVGALSLPPYGVMSVPADLSAGIPSLIGTFLGVYDMDTLLIRVSPRVLGEDLPVIEEKIPFDLKKIFSR